MPNPLITSSPYLMPSGFSGKVYVVTKYRIISDDLVEAHTKFDVTASFAEVAESLGYVKKEES